MIELRNLNKTFHTQDGALTALDDINLTVQDGEIFGIIGLSGAGKSTLVRCMNLLERPTHGEVLVDGQDLMKLSPAGLREVRRNIGMIFQSYNLLPTMTAAENVALPLMFKGIDKKTRLKLARKELKSMGLLGRANHLPTEMSGGQQQRVGIARAFVSNPKVIFADEPTGNLDSKTSKQVLYRMLELTKNQQVTFVMVTHEPELAECADRVVTILDGKVCSNVVQDEATKTRNREGLFADLQGDMSIGGDAAKEKSN